jgi:hypothetical protein
VSTKVNPSERALLEAAASAADVPMAALLRRFVLDGVRARLAAEQPKPAA